MDSDECLSISKVTIQREAGKITLEKKTRLPSSNGGRIEETIEEEAPTPNITSTPTKSLKVKKTKQCKVMWFIMNHVWYFCDDVIQYVGR